MVSSKDVARLAGVSQSTVSRVLNHAPNVSPETRQKVLSAIEQLQYTPNLIARSLVTQSTKTIALISGTLRNGFFVETTDAIVNYATARGYQTMVYFKEDGLDEVFDLVLGSKVDGLLLATIELDDPLWEKIDRSRIPCVFFNRKPREGGNYVIFDNQLAAELVANHLLELGHERIAFLCGNTNVSTFHDRKVGFEKAMEAAGVKIDPALVHVFDPKIPGEVEKYARKLMHMAHPPSAIFCSTDMIALLCMDAIMAMGYRIPEDVSVAGIDNISISAHQAIQLTSAGHAKFNLGELAVEYLIEMIEQEEKPTEWKQITLKPELFVRRTTARKGERSGASR